MTIKERFNAKNRATWVVAQFLDSDSDADRSWHTLALQHWTDAIKAGSETPRSRAVFSLALALEEDYRTKTPIDEGDRYEELLECAMIEVAWKDIAIRLIDDVLATRALRTSEPALPTPLQSITVPIGTLHYSPRIGALIDWHLVHQMLDRHAIGDWGNCCAEEWQANNLALVNGAELISKYRTRDGFEFWLVTKGDRSITTAILPDEY